MNLKVHKAHLEKIHILFSRWKIQEMNFPVPIHQLELWLRQFLTAPPSLAMWEGFDNS